ncbi:TPA: hypothetical protein ACOEOW_003865 [Enterobacter hormaechei subsp. xiangfangensis]
MAIPCSFEFPQYNKLVIYDALCHPINVTINPTFPAHIGAGQRRAIIHSARDLVTAHVRNNAISWIQSQLIAVARAGLDKASAEIDTAIKHIEAMQRTAVQPHKFIDLARYI